MSKENEIGIITEQGYVAGQGLGYTPTDLGKKNEPNSEKSDDK